jgi:arylsulfatase A-like enzyme
MPLEEVTLAEALQQAGYKTAFVGKWHLGPTEEFWPEHQGFAVNFGGHNRGLPPGGYFAPYRNPRLEDGPKGEHLTTRLTDESLTIIEQFREQPFLLYLSFYTVHTPLQAPKDLVAKYEAKARRVDGGEKPEFADEEQVWPVDAPRKVRIRQRHATYAAMVETMDSSVGRVLAKLKELELEDDTVICFTSDNGGLSTSEGSPTSNLPFRGGKGWTYEGGIREPFLIKWPGVTPAGYVCDTAVVSIDFYPTILEIAGIESKPARAVDGVSLVPLLRRTGELAPRALFWHYPHYSNQGGIPSGAIRLGDHKLIERYEDGRVHLYDLAKDPGERFDLAEQQPEVVAELRNRLHRWYREVDAKFLEAKDNGRQPWRP